MKEIIVEIGPKGEVKIEAVGFVGNECKAITAALEEALGTVTDTVEKPEFHMARTATHAVGH